MLVCLCSFLLLFSSAAWLYPGGNWIDRSEAGHSFWRNFFCDLTQPVSLSGVDNRLGARLAQASLLIFGGALGGLFWLLPRRFSARSRLARWVRAFGGFSLVCFVLVPLTPSERFGHLHALIALSAAALGALAVVLAVTALLMTEPRPKLITALGVAALLAGSIDGVLFARHLNDSAPPPLILPAAQKVAGLLVGLWITATALVELREQRALRAERNRSTSKSSHQ